MFHYRNEAAFSKVIVALLRRHRWYVQRIESGLTGRGIPDLYCINPHNTAVWIELKRVHGNVPDYVLDIPWRPGQQAWLYGVVKRKQCAYTLCCYDDYIVLINHDRLYAQDKVPRHVCVLTTEMKELV